MKWLKIVILQTHEEATVCFTELDIFLTMKVFEDALAVLSRKALRWKWIFLWMDQRSKTASNWKNSVRSWFPGLSTSSSTNFSVFILRLRLPHQPFVKWQWNGKIGETRWPSQPKIQNQISWIIFSWTQRVTRQLFPWSVFRASRSVDLCKHSLWRPTLRDARGPNTRAPCRRRNGGVVRRPENFWWLDNSRSQSLQWHLRILKQSSIRSRGAGLSHPMDPGASVQNQNFTRNPEKLAERAVRSVKEGTSAVLLQSGLNESWWADSMESYTYLRNVTDLLSDGKTPYERRFGQPFKRPIIPLGSLVDIAPF